MHAFMLVTLGLAIGAMGGYVAQADDAPGAAVMGALLMIAGLALGIRAARRRLPTWAARTALVVGVVVAGFAATLTHAVVVTAPLFAEARAVPSSSTSAVPPRLAAEVEQARTAVRAAIRAENLPGVSVAVGVDGALVWAEGFGWRDVDSRTPVTPRTRFHIGTAASVVARAQGQVHLADTGSDTAADWSPEHVGEEEEDFPPFALLRHLVLQPLGVAPAEYPLRDERATFYVPRDGTDPSRGRRLMYMRDLACCLEGRAFSSTPADLVRVALATHPDDVDGVLAGGTVMSLVSRADRGVVVAVTSNIAHAKTSALAARIADAFAAPVR